MVDKSKMLVDSESETPMELAKSPEEGTKFMEDRRLFGQGPPGGLGPDCPGFGPKNADGPVFLSSPKAWGEGNFNVPMDICLNPLALEEGGTYV
jgi:hypothetical protein